MTAAYSPTSFRLNTSLPEAPGAGARAGGSVARRFRQGNWDPRKIAMNVDRPWTSVARCAAGIRHSSEPNSCNYGSPAAFAAHPDGFCAAQTTR